MRLTLQPQGPASAGRRPVCHSIRARAQADGLTIPDLNDLMADLWERSRDPLTDTSWLQIWRSQIVGHSLGAEFREDRKIENGVRDCQPTMNGVGGEVHARDRTVEKIGRFKQLERRFSGLDLGTGTPAARRAPCLTNSPGATTSAHLPGEPHEAQTPPGRARSRMTDPQSEPPKPLPASSSAPQELASAQPRPPP